MGLNGLQDMEHTIWAKSYRMNYNFFNFCVRNRVPITAILSALMTVDNLCAIKIQVLPFLALFNAS